MPVYKQLPRERSKQIDEFRHWTMHLLERLAAHWRWVAKGVGVLVLLVALVLGIVKFQAARSEAAGLALYRASLHEENSAERVSALREVAQKYPRTPAGKIAAFQLASSLIHQGENEAAEKTLRELRDRVHGNPLLKVALLHQLAKLAEIRGAFDEACEAYRAASGEPGNIMSHESRYQEARCLEAKGDVTHAAEMYRDLMALEEIDAAVKAHCEERLLWLMAQGQLQEGGEQ